MWPGPEGLLTASPEQAVSLHHFTVLLRIQCGWLWHAPCSVAVTTLALPCSSNSSVLSHTEHTLFFCLEGPPCLTPLFLVKSKLPSGLSSGCYIWEALCDPQM